MRIRNKARGANNPRMVGCGPIVNKGIENKIRLAKITIGPFFDAIIANTKPTTQPNMKNNISSIDAIKTHSSTSSFN